MLWEDTSVGDQPKSLSILDHLSRHNVPVSQFISINEGIVARNFHFTHNLYVKRPFSFMSKAVTAINFQEHVSYDQQ